MSGESPPEHPGGTGLPDPDPPAKDGARDPAGKDIPRLFAASALFAVTAARAGHGEAGREAGTPAVPPPDRATGEAGPPADLPARFADSGGAAGLSATPSAGPPPPGLAIPSGTAATGTAVPAFVGPMSGDRALPDQAGTVAAEGEAPGAADGDPARGARDRQPDPGAPSPDTRPRTGEAGRHGSMPAPPDFAETDGRIASPADNPAAGRAEGRAPRAGTAMDSAAVVPGRDAPAGTAMSRPPDAPASANGAEAGALPAIPPPDPAPRTDRPEGAPRTAPPHSAAGPHPLADQIRLAVERTGEGGTEIRLDPAELGRVRLHLQSDDGRLTLSIQVERPETADAIRRQIDGLATELRALGYADVGISLGRDGDRGGGRTPGADPGADSAASGAAPPATDSPAPPAPRRAGGLDLRL